MARKSLESRMDRVMDALLAPGSFARREYDLPDHLRAALAQYRENQAAIISRAEKEHGSDWIELLFNGALETVRMPTVLRDGLGLADPPVITEDMTDAEAADLWHRFAQGDSR